MGEGEKPEEPRIPKDFNIVRRADGSMREKKLYHPSNVIKLPEKPAEIIPFPKNPPKKG